MGIDKSKYTHYAFYYGIPAYWNDNTNELGGRNFLFDKLADIATYFDCFVAFPVLSILGDEPAFAIKVGGPIE